MPEPGQFHLCANRNNQLCLCFNQATKVHSKSLDTYFRNRNNFYMVQYFYPIFSMGIESELLSIFSYKLYKNIVCKVAKKGPKNLNFQSFALYKGKIISQCSLEFDDSKNIYFSRVIFNIFRRNTSLFHIFVEIYQNPFILST